jgi:hypothetical protein
VPTELPPPDAIRRLAGEILSRPEYQHERSNIPLVNWIKEMGEWFRGLLKPVSRGLDALYDVSPILFWIVAALMVLLALVLMVHIVWFTAGLFRRHRLAGTPGLAAPQPVTPERWEEAAHQALADKRYIDAVRNLFRAGLLRLEASRRRPMRRSATNREHLRAFRETPAFEPLTVFVETIDNRWYAGADCSQEDYGNCSSAYARICELTEAPAGA